MVKKYGPAVVLLLASVTLQGCYHFRVTAPQPNPATEDEQVRVSLLWGLIQKDRTAIECEQSSALDEVTVSTNFAFLLVSVATAGIVVPATVSWKCAKASIQEGEIGQVVGSGYREDPEQLE